MLIFRILTVKNSMKRITASSPRGDLDRHEGLRSDNDELVCHTKIVAFSTENSKT